MNYSKLSLLIGRIFGFLALADAVLCCCFALFEAIETSTSPVMQMIKAVLNFKAVVIFSLLSIVFLIDGYIRSKNL